MTGSPVVDPRSVGTVAVAMTGSSRNARRARTTGRRERIFRQTGRNREAGRASPGAMGSVREVIETARQVTGHLIPSKELPRRPGDSPRLVASSEKIKRELGWKPQHDNIHEIITSAWAWHKWHPKGYE